MHFVDKFLPFLRRHDANQRPTFVELGGNDGLRSSNSLFLENCLRWRGVMLEGHPAYRRRLAYNRPALVTIGSAVCEQTNPDERRTVQYSADASVVASVIETAAVASNRTSSRPAPRSVAAPCGALQSFLSPLAVRHVDLLSVDVEGYELVVLESLDWSKFTAATLIVEEFTVPGTDPAARKKNRRNAAVQGLLPRLGFTRALTTCFAVKQRICDHYFVAPAHYDMVGLRGALGPLFGAKASVRAEEPRNKCT